MRSRGNRYLLPLGCLALCVWLPAGSLGAEAVRQNDEAQDADGAPVPPTGDAAIRPPDPEKAVDEQVALLTRELELDKQQVRRIRPILLDRQKKINQHIGIAYDAKTQVEVRKTVYALQAEVEAQLARILSEAQMKRFEELKQQELMRRGKRPPRVAVEQDPPSS